MSQPPSPLLRVLEREMRVFRRLWRGNAFSSVLSPVLFLAAMGLGLGGIIDDRSGGVDGLSYLEFIAPGLLAAGVMQAAAAESMWPVMAGQKWVGWFHAMVATPLSPADVYAGRVLWTGLRTVLSSAIFLVVAALFGGVPSPWGVLAVPAAVLTAMAIAAPVVAFTGTQDTDLSLALIFRLGVVPLFLFSGTFFPVSQLPDSVEPLAFASPLWHGVELARAATTGSAALDEVVVHVVVLVGVIAAGWRWGTRTFTRRLAA